MLKYIEESTAKNIINQDIKRVDELVSHIKQSEEVGINYMKSWEWEKYIKETATAEGLAEGRAEGLAEGLAEGRTEGLEEAMVKVILNMHEMGYTFEQISMVTEKTTEEIKAVIEKKVPFWYNRQQKRGAL